ncbi:unnamed protein product [Boreogadus saida]
MYDTSFTVLGPKLWNLIPANVSSVKDLEVFKIELNKDFLSKMPDKSPVKGYSCENNNSLLECRAQTLGCLKGLTADAIFPLRFLYPITLQTITFVLLLGKKKYTNKSFFALTSYTIK